MPELCCLAKGSPGCFIYIWALFILYKGESRSLSLKTEPPLHSRIPELTNWQPGSLNWPKDVLLFGCYVLNHTTYF